MNDTYNEFSGTELDQDADFNADFEWDDEGGNDLIPILGLSAAVAAVVGAILVLAGRRRKKTPMERVEAFLGDVGKEGKKAARQVGRSVREANLGDLLSEAMDRAGEAAGNVDLAGFAGDVKKRARKLTGDMHLGSMLEDALDQAKRASKRMDLDDRARDVGKKVSGAVSNIPRPDIDTKGVESFLDALKDKLSGAIDSVRSDIAPKAADLIRDDVIPAAQGAAASVVRAVREDVLPAAGEAMHKVREDVLPAVEERASKFMGDTDAGKRARRVASSAGEGALSFADLARGLAASVAHRVIEDVLPEVKKMGGKAVKTARQDVMPAAERFAGKAAGVVREDVLPKVGEVAAQTPDALGALLGVAREKAEAAMDKAGPLASDAAEYGRHRLSDFATFTRHRAGDVASGLGAGRDGLGGMASGVASSVGQGVGGAFSTVGRGVGGAVGGAASAVGHGTRAAVGATTYATRESVGILFWLAALGGLILLVFVSDKERQKEIVNGALQFFNEVREMWTDLRGPDYAPETESAE